MLENRKIRDCRGQQDTGRISVISMVRGKGGCVGMDVGLSSYTRTEFVRLCRPHGRKHDAGECNEQDSIVHSP